MSLSIKDIQEELSYVRELKKRGVTCYGLFSEPIDDVIDGLEKLITKRIKDIENECQKTFEKSQNDEFKTKRKRAS